MTDSAPEQEFGVTTAGGVPVVAGPAEIDIGNAHRLREALESAGSGQQILVADLSRTEFCDSSGLSALLMAHKRMHARGGELRLVLGGPVVRRLLALTGMDKIFRTWDSLAEALAAAPPDPASPPDPAQPAPPLAH